MLYYCILYYIHKVEDPEELFSSDYDYDVVVVASGRHGLTEEWREVCMYIHTYICIHVNTHTHTHTHSHTHTHTHQERDLPVRETGHEEALIFQFKGARGSERAAAAADASLTRTFKVRFSKP